MRVLIATDAWHPQVNGVVTTLTRLGEEAALLGAEITFLTPDRFFKVSCPGYPEIGLALARRRAVAQAFAEVAPDFVHIATEGPIGWAVRRHCLMRGLRFTTSYHTKFPEYARKLLGIPSAWVYRLEKLFHGPSSGIMVSTPSLEAELRGHGFSRLMRWSRGVDIELFRPSDARLFGTAEPVFLFVGRVSREKNVSAFLDLDLPGRKVVVGNGPHLDELRRRYKDVLFTGRKTGADLAAAYASADVFVFPSLTDTFGLVLLEAMASGVPVAAYPVTGPIDVVENGRSGVLDDDLGRAARAALALDRNAARERALTFTWSQSTQQFLDNLTTAAPSGSAVAVGARRGDRKPLAPRGAHV